MPTFLAVGGAPAVAMSGAAIGWFGGFIGAIGLGSFAVPIKGEAANSVDVDPLVMQTYKTMMCFATSWLVLLTGQEFSFTWWGVVSGLFWVPGGTLNIFAIRNAGLAISQGIVSSTAVMVSFLWGNIIFEEEVQSQTLAYFAICQIMVGLWGMSYYSSGGDAVRKRGQSLVLEDDVLEDEDGHDAERERMIEMTTKPPPQSRTPPSSSGVPLPVSRERQGFKSEPSSSSLDSAAAAAAVSTSAAPPTSDADAMRSPSKPTKRVGSPAVLVCGRAYARRDIGLLCAMLCGLWGGSVLVPMHYATVENTDGLGFVISFSVGASIVTISGWIMRFGFHLVRSGGSVRDAYGALPSFHWKVLWRPGMTAGVVWSLGNVGSIVAVKYLGQGVGYSSSQASLMIAGMWGMFYFKEVSNTVTMVKWFLSAFVTIGGILLLGYESHVAPHE